MPIKQKIEEYPPEYPLLFYLFQSATFWIKPINVGFFCADDEDVCI